jgi:hypothetical protein
MKKLLFALIVVMVGLVSFGIGRLSALPLNVENEVWTENDLSLENAMFLSSESLNDLEPSDQYETFFTRHQELVALSIELRNAWDVLKLSRSETLSYRNQIKENQIKLSLEDRLEIRNDLLLLKELKETFSETNGVAYEKLSHLRGNFNIENIDLILSTYVEVIDILTLRLNLLQQANQIMVQLNTRLLVYIES